MKNIALLSLLLAIGCKDPAKSEKDQMRKADWLIGSWESEAHGGRLVERWSRVNDSTFAGESYFIREKDTLNNEHIVLAQRGTALVYSPTVIGQNNDKPVDFKLTGASKTQLTFENAQHDFPKKIVYRRVSADSLVASVSGVENGKSSQEVYPMARSK